jgi:hypothetical protein
MPTYAGKLGVEPNDFSLRVERLIIREREIAFDLRYRDPSDPIEYLLNSRATMRSEGYYESPSISPRNSDYLGEATIYILRAKQSENNCFIEGFWFEKEEGAWRFSGSLEPYRATT